MSTMTLTRLETMPRVNLLPPEIAERNRFRRVQIGLVGAGLAAAAAVVALYLLASAQVGEAQSDLDTRTEAGKRLQREVDSYARVPEVRAQVEAAETRLVQAMGSEVRWSYFLNDLSLTLPRGVWVTKLSVSQAVEGTPGGAAAASGSRSALSSVGAIGQVEFTGRAFRHTDVAAFLDSLAKQKGYANPYFKSSAFEDEQPFSVPTVAFVTTTVVDEDALSKRYIRKAAR